MIETLLPVLSKPLAKFLLGYFIGDLAGDVGGELAGMAAGRIGKIAQRRRAERLCQDTADRVAETVLDAFPKDREGINAEAVVHEVTKTLENNVSAKAFLKMDLDAGKLTKAFRQQRPLPKAMFSEVEEAFYDRTLDTTVRCLVDVAASLGGFDSAYPAESLMRLSRILGDTGKILANIGDIKALLTGNAGDDSPEAYEETYREAVISNLDFLELFGVDNIGQEAKRNALSVAFVSLNLSGGGKDDDELLPVDEALGGLARGTGRLLVRGEAGSGKSTLFRWAAIEAAKGPWVAIDSLRRFPLQIIDDDRPVAHLDLEWDWRSRVPFLIRLRDCKGGHLPRPEDFHLMVAWEKRDPPKNWAVSVLESGRAMVLLDGVDEVPEKYRDTVRAGIEIMTKAYPENLFLVSTRPKGAKARWLAGLGFGEAEIYPMSEMDKGHFIDKWHAAVEAQLERAGIPEVLTGVAAALKAQLRGNPPISRLATYPLLCAAICALHWGRNENLPESQAGLCEALCQLLLDRRERETLDLDLGEFPEVYRDLSYEQKRAVTQDMAHFMVCNEISAIPTDRATTIAEETLAGLSDGDARDAEVVRGGLLERGGIMREAFPGHIDFIHNTLKEFLAADRFAEGGFAGQLAGNCRKPAWHPVIVFAAATRKRGFADDLIDKILERGGSGEPTGKKTRRTVPRRTAELLALQCRTAAIYLDEATKQRVASIEKDLFPPRTLTDAAVLAEGGDAVVPFLARRPRMGARPAAACVRTLRFVGTPKAQQCLRDYFDDKRITVLTELAQAVNPLELPAFRDMVSEGKRLPKGVAAQVTDLGSLAGLTALQSLDLANTDVTDLGPLTGLKALQSLDLEGTKVTDLGPLTGLKALQSLDLEGTKVTDLGPLADLPALRSLDLMFTQVTNLGPLADLTALQSFSLARSQVTDLGPLARLTALRRLFLGGVQATDLEPLAGLTALNSLILMYSQVSDLGPLAGLTALQLLDLRGTKVTDLEPLAGLTALRSLHLGETKVTDLGPLAGREGLKIIGGPESRGG
jgi:hypothetical protein